MNFLDALGMSLFGSLIKIGANDNSITQEGTNNIVANNSQINITSGINAKDWTDFFEKIMHETISTVQRELAKSGVVMSDDKVRAAKSYITNMILEVKDGKFDQEAFYETYTEIVHSFAGAGMSKETFKDNLTKAGDIAVKAALNKGPLLDKLKDTTFTNEDGSIDEEFKQSLISLIK